MLLLQVGVKNEGGAPAEVDEADGTANGFMVEAVVIAEEQQSFRNNRPHHLLLRARQPHQRQRTA